MLASMSPLKSAMAPTPSEIEEARRHVALAAKAVGEQRTRLERLRRNGRSTSDAERLLVTFEEVLFVMRKHLSVEESF